MKQIRRIKLTVLRRRSVWRIVRAHCPICARTVETLTIIQAAEILEVTLHMLNAFITEGQVHTIPTVSGSLRICQDSLFGEGDRDDAR